MSEHTATQTRQRARRPLDLTRPETVRAVMRRAGMHASKRLGQHFLVDRAILETIVDALAPSAGATVIEIGCGVGTLTAELATVAARVVALDVDPACVRAAQITLRTRENVDVVRADARHLEPAQLGAGDLWFATGNLPYHLTGVLLNRLFELASPPRTGVFLVQREVAARLMAAPGDWSAATVALRSLADIERLRDVPPDAFLPPPAVHSSVVRLTPSRSLEPAERATTLDLARRVFQQRRKTIRHGLTHALDGDGAGASAALDDAGVDAGRRPGTLGLNEWAGLARAVARVRGSGA